MEINRFVSKDYKDRVNQDEIYFISVGKLASWGKFFLDIEENRFLVSIGEKLESSKADMLLAVKYLGMGVLQEMTTGEKIVFAYGDVISDSNEFNSEHGAFSNIEDFQDMYGETIEDYIYWLEVGKHKINEFPFVYEDEDLSDGMGYGVYYITDESKKAYLKYSDDERKELITFLKKKAVVENQKLIDEIIEIEGQYDSIDIETIMAKMTTENKGKSI